jgi:hypothetical protein
VSDVYELNWNENSHHTSFLAKYNDVQYKVHFYRVECFTAQSLYERIKCFTTQSAYEIAKKKKNHG